MPDREKHALLSIIDSIQTIETAVKDIPDAEKFQANRICFDAVLMNFINIGEMPKRISDISKGKHPEIEWSKILDFRNLVAHDYLGVDAEEVWQIIQKDIPTLKNAVKSLLAGK